MIILSKKKAAQLSIIQFNLQKFLIYIRIKSEQRRSRDSWIILQVLACNEQSFALRQTPFLELNWRLYENRC